MLPRKEEVPEYRRNLGMNFAGMYVVETDVRIGMLITLQTISGGRGS